MISFLIIHHLYGCQHTHTHTHICMHTLFSGKIELFLFPHYMPFIKLQKSCCLTLLQSCIFPKFKELLYIYHTNILAIANRFWAAAWLSTHLFNIFSITFLFFIIYFFWKFCRAVAYIPLTVLAVPASVLTVSIKNPFLMPLDPGYRFLFHK